MLGRVGRGCGPYDRDKIDRPQTNFTCCGNGKAFRVLGLDIVADCRGPRGNKVTATAMIEWMMPIAMLPPVVLSRRSDTNALFQHGDSRCIQIILFRFRMTRYGLYTSSVRGNDVCGRVLVFSERLGVRRRARCGSPNSACHPDIRAFSRDGTADAWALDGNVCWVADAGHIVCLSASLDRLCRLPRAGPASSNAAAGLRLTTCRDRQTRKSGLYCHGGHSV